MPVKAQKCSLKCYVLYQTQQTPFIYFLQVSKHVLYSANILRNFHRRKSYKEITENSQNIARLHRGDAILVMYQMLISIDISKCLGALSVSLYKTIKTAIRTRFI